MKKINRKLIGLHWYCLLPYCPLPVAFIAHVRPFCHLIVVVVFYGSFTLAVNCEKRVARQSDRERGQRTAGSINKHPTEG